jgi:hypothetical protein
VVYELGHGCEKKPCSREHTCLRTQSRKIQCREVGLSGSIHIHNLLYTRILRRSLDKPRLILIHYPPINTSTPPYPRARNLRK